jgi:hypothetical protein
MHDLEGKIMAEKIGENMLNDEMIFEDDCEEEVDLIN